MNALPLWAQIMQALLTPTIAIAVGTIYFLQWRTAHKKVVLDLFEKRLAVYRQIEDAVRVVNTHGRTSREAETNLLEARGIAEFLFGSDIRDYLDEMWSDFAKLTAANSMLQSSDVETRSKNAMAASNLSQKITLFYYQGPDRFAPYMRHEHRLSNPPKRVRTRPGTPTIGR